MSVRIRIRMRMRNLVDDLGDFLDYTGFQLHDLSRVTTPPDDPGDDEHCQQYATRDEPVLDLADALFGQVVAQPVSHRDEKPAAYQRRESVGDHELDEVVARRAGRDDHRAADAGEQSPHRDNPDAVLFEHL